VNSETTVRAMLADLAGDPPVGIDLDRQISRGRRRVMRRRTGAMAGAVTAVLCVAAGSVALAPADSSARLTIGTRPRATELIRPWPAHTPSLPPSLWCAEGEPQIPRVDPTTMMPSPSTARSKALATELAAGLTGVEAPEGRIFREDSEFYDGRCRPMYVATATVNHYIRVGNQDRWLYISAAIDKKPDFVDARRRACLDQRHDRSRCLGVHHLPGGSTLYLVHLWSGPYFVQIVRPDGTEIDVTSNYQSGPNDTPEQGNPYTIDVLTGVVEHLTVPW
jgi:hypothetical protein